MTALLANKAIVHKGPHGIYDKDGVETSGFGGCLVIPEFKVTMGYMAKDDGVEDVKKMALYPRKQNKKGSCQWILWWGLHGSRSIT